MSDIGTVLDKVFVREFYRLNASFFILVITLAFGFMSGVEHRALAEFFISAPSLAIIPITLWIVYAYKIRVFNKQRLRFPENNFLFHLTLLSSPTRLLLIGTRFALQFAPAIAYSIFLVAMAIKNVNLLSAALISAAIAVILVAFTFIFNYDLAHPATEAKVSKLRSYLNKHTVKPIWWIYVLSIFRQEPFLFLATKAFTGVLLFGVLQLYRHESFDGRLIAMATTVAAASNFSIMQLLHGFDFRSLTLMKNLPLGTTKRWWIILLAATFLMLPEIGVLIQYSENVSLPSLASAGILIPTMAMLLYSFNFVKFKTAESSSRLFFGVTVLHITLILFGVPVIVFAATDMLLSYYFFAQRYYSFEISVELKK